MTYKKTGEFYLLPLNNLDNNESYFLENLVCKLTKKHWRLGKSILISCRDKSQANQIDKLLWMSDKNSFLPHNLFGKNIKDTPIVIFWPQCCYDNIERDLLINLMEKCMEFFFHFNKIIDFVPPGKILKQSARIRYKFYKKIGFNLSITNTLNYINN